MTESAKARDEGFAAKPVTRIWLETSQDSNPYVADKAYCHGYDVAQLAQHCSFAATLFLLFKGELPTAAQERLFNALLVAMINAGPRHQAVRAAQLAGAGKTEPQHILPIALEVLGGEAERLPAIMKFLVRALKKSPAGLLQQFGAERFGVDVSSDVIEQRLPGFGRRFGAADPQLHAIAGMLLELEPSAAFLRWGNELHSLLASASAGWLRTGVIAAALLDLGFPARSGCVLYQLINAPGIAAHGLEMHGLPRTALPFLPDDNYFQENPDE